jgi:ketosteroid isomerase-like protein
MKMIEPCARNKAMRVALAKTALALMTIIGLVGCDSNGGSPSGDHSQVMRNKELVSTFFEHFSAGEIDPAFALVSDDVSWWVPGDLPFSGTKTKEEYMQVVGSIQKGFPDGLELQATGMIAEGNQVAVEVASFGKHVNGKTHTNKYHFLITIEDGKIVDVKEYMDTLHLFQLIQP